MDIWRTIAERKVQEAMEEGEFENLQGAGEPLNLDEDPFTDPALRMAHRLLRNNGFAPAWIEEGSEIEAEAYRARAELRRSRGEAEALDRFRRAAAEVNRRIASYNLRTPALQTQKLPIDIEREIGRTLPADRHFRMKFRSRPAPGSATRTHSATRPGPLDGPAPNA